MATPTNADRKMARAISSINSSITAALFEIDNTIRDIRREAPTNGSQAIRILEDVKKKLSEANHDIVMKTKQWDV
jgi:hypothetical protein